MPDAADALSGLQTTCSRRPDKHSAIRQFRAPCRMRLTPYPAYKLHAAIGLISTAPSGSSAHSALMLPTPYPAYKLHAAVGLISSAHQAALRTVPDAANTLSGLQTTRSRRPDKLREHRHLANQAISSAVLPFGAGYALSNCFNSSTESVIPSAAAFCSTCATLAAFGMAITPD